MITTTCTSLLIINPITMKTVIHIDRNQISIVPLPSGRFTVTKKRDNEFILTIDGFDPIFGPPAKDYLQTLGDKDNLT